MAETVIVCSRGFADSISGSAYIAVQLKGMGQDVALVYDWDALIAFAEGRFESTPLQAGYVATMIENAGKMGITEVTDPMAMLKRVKAAGVPIYTCGTAVDLLGLKGKLPPEIEPLYPDAIKLLAEAKKVISG